jgi:hypothetical protein
MRQRLKGLRGNASKDALQAMQRRVQDIQGQVAAAEEIKDGHCRTLDTLKRAREEWREREQVLEGVGVSFPVARMRMYSATNTLDTR